MTDDLAYAGVAGQAEAVRAGDVSARELTELLLARIERHNGSLTAFTVVMAEEALAEAARRDETPRPTVARCTGCRSRSRRRTTSRAA